MNITFKGNPVTLEGNTLKAGDRFPDFAITDNDLGTFRLSDTKGVRVIATVPSVDTSVCALEVRTFNQKAAKIPGVSVIVVSMDLPFAQQRWCAAEGIEAVKTYSDYKDHSFGHATGTYVKELGLLARAVFVVDGTGVITHAEYVPEIGHQPDFDRILEKVGEAK